MAKIRLDRMCETCLWSGSPEIWLVVGKGAMVRLVDGLRCLAVDVVETGSLQLLIRAAAPLEAWDRYQSEGVADFGFEYAGSERFHLTAFADEGKPRAALLRHLSKEP